MDIEEFPLLSSEEVAGLENKDNVEGLRYLESEDIGKLTDNEDKDREESEHVQLVQTKSVCISEENNVVRTFARESEDRVYTVEDAIDHMGFGPFQIVVTIFAGMIWISDAMELMLLSILSPIVTCDWFLSDWEEALITSVVFVGFFIGGLFWGAIADVVGRKKTLLIVDIVVLFFGLASAIAPNYGTLLLFRCLAGFGIGGSAQAVTYYVEFLPKKVRGVCIVLLELWWAVGSVFAALLALAVIPNVPDPIETSTVYNHINWRLYVGLSALPLALVLFLFLVVPESARYYVSHGKVKKGEEVIKHVARLNFKSPPIGRLVSQEEKERLEEEQTSVEDNTSLHYSKESSLSENLPENNDNGMSPEEAPLLNGREQPPLMYSVYPDEVNGTRLTKLKVNVIQAAKKVGRDLTVLFTGGMWKTSVLLLFIWLGCAWLYYGAVLLTTTILESGYDPHCGKNQSDFSTGCQNLTTSFYTHIVWTSAAEFPGIIITLIIIELIGRKITMSIEFVGTGLFFGLLLICVPEIWLTVFLFGARGFATGVFQAVYVYTPEVFPTKVRGIAMGVMTSAARIGALVTPFFAQALFPISDYATLSLYIGSSLILAILSLLLPIETKGRSLKDLHG